MIKDWQQPSSPDEEIIIVSKSELKRDAEYLQKLAGTILKLTPANLKKVPLDDELKEAIELAIKIKDKHGAYKRQLHYVGKLLRFRDYEIIEEIRIAIAKIENQHVEQNQLLHKLEKTREKVIAQGDSAINELVQQYPDLDRSRLRQLVRQAQKEQNEQKPAKASREIFQYLKENLKN